MTDSFIDKTNIDRFQLLKNREELTISRHVN